MESSELSRRSLNVIQHSERVNQTRLFEMVDRDQQDYPEKANIWEYHEQLRNLEKSGYILISEGNSYSLTTRGKQYLDLFAEIKDQYTGIQCFQNNVATFDSQKTFCSYSRADVQFASELFDVLRNSKFNLWIDQVDIKPGRPWDSEIEEAIKGCVNFLIILSPMSITSQNVLDGMSFAIDEKKNIIPIKAVDCILPLRLRRLQFIDFTNRNYQIAIDEVKTALSSK